MFACTVINSFIQGIKNIQKEHQQKNKKHQEEQKQKHQEEQNIVTSTRTQPEKTNELITLKNNEEFCIYVNELAEWTYIESTDLT